MMKTPKRCGRMYIMFDENSVPLYGFKVEKAYDCGYLKDFVLMWTVFNLFIKFMTLLLLFLMFWFFGP